MDNIKIGVQGRCELIVTEENSAANWASGNLNVFATPAMIAMMENAAYKAVKNFLPEGTTTVGTAISVEHTAATPLGLRAWAIATLTKADGRGFEFDIEAFDEKGPIGTAKHTRFAVITDRFMLKVNAKLNR